MTIKASHATDEFSNMKAVIVISAALVDNISQVDGTGSAQMGWRNAPPVTKPRSSNARLTIANMPICGACKGHHGFKLATGARFLLHMWTRPIP